MILLIFSWMCTAFAGDYRTPADVLANFKDEPSVRQVQEMAEEYAKTDPGHIDAWLKAAKSAALLPQLTLEGEYKDKWRDSGEYFDTDGDSIPDSSYYTTEGYDEYYYRVKGQAKWNLDELVMSGDRIRLISEAQDIAKLRDKVLEDVTRIYFERRKLQCDMLLTPGDEKAQLKNELRLEELTAELDAYTGGRFTRSVGK